MHLIGDTSKYGDETVELCETRRALALEEGERTFPLGLGGLVPLVTVRASGSERRNYVFRTAEADLAEPEILVPNQPAEEPKAELVDTDADELAAEAKEAGENDADELAAIGEDDQDGDAALIEPDELDLEEMSAGAFAYYDENSAYDEDNEVEEAEEESRSPVPTTPEFAWPVDEDAEPSAQALDRLARAVVLVNKLLDKAQDRSHHEFGRVEDVVVGFEATGWMFSHVEINDQDRYDRDEAPLQLYIETTSDPAVYPRIQARLDFDANGYPRRVMVSEKLSDQYSHRLEADTGAGDTLDLFKVEEFLGGKGARGHILYKKGGRNGAFRRFPNGTLNAQARAKEAEVAAEAVAAAEIDEATAAAAEGAEVAATATPAEGAAGGQERQRRVEHDNYLRIRETPMHSESVYYGNDARDLRPGRVHAGSDFRYSGKPRKMRRDDDGPRGGGRYNREDGDERRGPRRDRDDRREHEDRRERKEYGGERPGRGGHSSREDRRGGYGERDRSESRDYGERRSDTRGRGGHGSRDDRRGGYGDRPGFGNRENRGGYRGDRDRGDSRGYGERTSRDGGDLDS